MQTTTEQNTGTEQPQADLYRKLSETIIGYMETGNTPWQKSIADAKSNYPRMPVNIISGKDYTGINALLLWCAGLQHGYASHEWAGFRQWKEREENIRKGERGVMAVYYDTGNKEENSEAKKAVLKSYVLFNRCQLGSFEAGTATEATIRPLAQRLAEVQSFVENTKVVISHKGKKALYDTAIDEIRIPKREAFKKSFLNSAVENYYSSLFPELIRWTGHKQRLDRSFNQRFKDEAAIAEELTAAMGSAFLCAEFGINLTLLEDRAERVPKWIAVLQENKFLITTVATAAWRATHYLRQLQPGS